MPKIVDKGITEIMEIIIIVLSAISVIRKGT